MAAPAAVSPAGDGPGVLLRHGIPLGGGQRGAGDRREGIFLGNVLHIWKIIRIHIKTDLFTIGFA